MFRYCSAFLYLQAQLGLLVILVVAIINYFVGTFLTKKEEQQWNGIVGYKGTSIVSNLPAFVSRVVY
jgi:hypothetical protein